MAYGDGAGGGRGGLGVAQGDATSQGKTEPQPSESIGKLNTSTVALAEPPRAPAYPDWLYTYRTLIAASAASVCSVLAGSPFDSIKLRMQTAHFPSTAACVRQIWEREGVHGFFRGILPPLCTVNIIKTVSVGVYEKSRVDLPALTRGWMRGETPAVYFCAGLLAGSSTAALSCPLELIRNQRILHDVKVEANLRLLQQRSMASGFAASSSPANHAHTLNGHVASTGHSVSSSTLATTTSTNTTSTPRANSAQPLRPAPSGPTVSAAIRNTSSLEYARVLVRNHGVAGGLYRGFHAHFLRESIGTGIYWLSYEMLHRVPGVSPTGRRQDASAAGHFMAGGLTGMIAWVFIFPIDLVKNVYQKDASVAGQQRYSSLRHCVRSIYRRNGMGGFYNGLWATMYRAFPIHAINLLVYEYFLTLLSEGGLTAVAGEL